MTIAIAVAVVAWLYAAGIRRQRPRLSRAMLHARALAFAAALIVLLLALEPPLDDYADRLFSAHMLQHLLLIGVVAPLLVLAAPWMEIWRGVPLGARRALARAVLVSDAARPLRRAGALLYRPAPVFVLFNAALVGWHVPAAYDLALRHQAVHDLEHLSFLVFSTLFWLQMLDSRPFHRTLEGFGAVGYALGAVIVGWTLAVALSLASAPLYAYYAGLAHRPGGISALTDQRLASGIMWVPAALPYAAFGFFAIYRWLDEQEGGFLDSSGGRDGGSRVPPRGGRGDGRRRGSHRHRPRRSLTRV